LEIKSELSLIIFFFISDLTTSKLIFDLQLHNSLNRRFLFSSLGNSHEQFVLYKRYSFYNFESHIDEWKRIQCNKIQMQDNALVFALRERMLAQPGECVLQYTTEQPEREAVVRITKLVLYEI